MRKIKIFQEKNESNMNFVDENIGFFEHVEKCRIVPLLTERRGSFTLRRHPRQRGGFDCRFRGFCVR